MTFTALETITLGIALLGAALGVLNTWRSFRQDRVRLVVEPTISAIGNRSLRLSVCVTNLSAFEVRIEEVGFVLGRSYPRLAFGPESLGAQEFQVALPPRASTAAFAPAAAQMCEELSRVRAVYVRTACGHEKLATSAALKWFVQHRPAAAHPREVPEYRADRDGLVVSSIYGPPKQFRGQLPE